MWQAGLLTLFVLVVFSLGRSPVFRVDRAGAAIIAAAMMVGLGCLTFQQAVQCIDFRTIAILLFMMIILANLKVAGFFGLVGDFVLRIVKTRKQLLFAVIITSGVLSAICINDIVCLMFTPIVLLICRKAQCNPIPYLIAVAIASNIGSAATFLGNPQNILIANLSGVPFASYFLTASPVAAAGLFISFYIIALLYRKDIQGEIIIDSPQKERFNRYLIFKSLAVLLLVIAGYIAGRDLAVASSLGAAFLLVTRRVKPDKIYAAIDFNLLLIFVGLFVVIGGLEHSGLMALIIKKTSGFIDFGNRSVFAVVTVFLSNIVSNVPAVLLLKFFLPATGTAAWWKALALFSTFAGNLTITGSVANLIVIEIAKKEKINISFLDYLKAGLPITIITCLMGLAALSYFN